MPLCEPRVGVAPRQQIPVAVPGTAAPPYGVGAAKRIAWPSQNVNAMAMICRSHHPGFPSQK